MLDRHYYCSLMWYYVLVCCCFFFFFKQKTAYEMRISDWSSDVCSSDLAASWRIARYCSSLLVPIAGVSSPQIPRTKTGLVSIPELPPVPKLTMIGSEDRKSVV